MAYVLHGMALCFGGQLLMLLHFRFSTKFEIFLDIVGLFCSAVAGAAQVRIFHMGN